MSLMGIVKVHDVRLVVIPGRVAKGRRRTVFGGIVGQRGVFQIVRGVIELCVDYDLQAEAVSLGHERLQLRRGAEVGVGAVEVPGIVPVIARLVACAAELFVVLRGRHPYGRKAEPFDIRQLLPQPGPVSPLVVAEVSWAVFFAQNSVVAAVAVKKAVRYEHIDRVSLVEALL